MREIPVYLVVGFLDSGKTSFINDILKEGFALDGGRTLLITCEEGEVEYEEAALREVEVVSVEEENDLDYGQLKKWEKQYRPTQIIVEYNGMWLMDSLTELLPKNWILYQIMTFVQADTFELYSANLGQLMMEKIKYADMIVFNRCTEELKTTLRSRNLRMVNRQADIFLEGADGKPENYLTGNERPFDMEQEIIEIPDEDYGVWYVDVMDHPEAYKGKKVRVKLQMCHSVQYPGVSCPGRFAMVCCEADITFFGIMATGEMLEAFADREWIEVTALLDLVKHPAYDTGDGPVMNILTCVACEKPEDEVVSF